MSDKINTGNKGEALAAEFLENEGFEIVQRNFRYGHGEIDLIAKRNDWVLFVEVKTRSSTDYGQPEDFVDDRKINLIFDTAENWVYDNNWKGNIRFDIISVKMGTIPEIEHFVDAIN